MYLEQLQKHVDWRDAAKGYSFGTPITEHNRKTIGKQWVSELLINNKKKNI